MLHVGEKLLNCGKGSVSEEEERAPQVAVAWKEKVRAF